MSYYYADELDDCVLTRTETGIEVVTAGETIAVAPELLRTGGDWLQVDGDGDVITLCGRYRYSHVGMTIRREPVYRLVADLQAAS